MAASHREGSEELARRDAVMDQLCLRHGPMRLASAPPVEKRFEALANAIVSQQLNGRAAATIWGRVKDSVGESFTPGAVLSLPLEQLRGAGLSGSKTLSLLDLAEHVDDGRVNLRRIGYLRDDEVISHLTSVRGIGPWTAQMFLIFSLRRLDVWPTGDYGVRNGYAKAYGTGHMPSASELDAWGDQFRPYRSVAAWYCWKAADDPELAL